MLASSLRRIEPPLGSIIRSKFHFDSGGIEVSAVVELDAFAQLEDDLLWVRDVDRLGQLRLRFKSLSRPTRLLYTA